MNRVMLGGFLDELEKIGAGRFRSTLAGGKEVVQAAREALATPMSKGLPPMFRGIPAKENTLAHLFRRGYKRARK